MLVSNSHNCPCGLTCQVLAAHGGVESLDVVYTDDRGDELCIRSEAEYREALQFSEQEGGTWRISLELSPNLSTDATSLQSVGCGAESAPVAEPGLIVQATVDGGATVDIALERDEAESAPVAEPGLIVQATVNGGATVDIALERDEAGNEASFAKLCNRWENPCVTYVDEEGDVITVGSEMEWREALRCAAQDGVMRVNVALGSLPAPALEQPAPAAAPGSATLVVNVQGTSGERMIRTTADAPSEEVAALAGAAALENLNSHGDLQLDVAIGKRLAGSQNVQAADPVAATPERAGDSAPMPDEMIGEALHGWLLARARSTTPSPSPLAFALHLVESQEWDGEAQKLTLLSGSVAPAAAVGRGPEVFVTESCWGTMSVLGPPAETNARAKVTGSVLLQIAHGTIALRQVDLRNLSASKVRASRGSDGDVVRCAASSSGGTLSVKINEDGVRLDRGEELLIQYAV
eukprot:COSAG02_NODE_56_length_43700_cov_33.650765_17_plen_465_part_00